MRSGRPNAELCNEGSVNPEPNADPEGVKDEIGGRVTELLLLDACGGGGGG